MGKAVVVKEVDGGRSVEIEVTSDLVFMEAGGHCFMFDKALVLHAMQKAFNISVILDHGMEEDFALP